ncbi:hypothetical protein COOONC_17134, partial [Cooperia oncophora]
LVNNNISDSPIDIALRSPAYDSSFLSATLADGKAHPVVDVHIVQNENDYSSQVASLDQSGTVSLWMVLRDSQGRPGVRPQAQLALQLLALIRPEPMVLRSAAQPTPLIANCMMVHPAQQLFLVGTDTGFLCSLSKAKTDSTKGPRLMNSKMRKIFGGFPSLTKSCHVKTVVFQMPIAKFYV